jgi:RimJ/RimL family protein N-acetyltransferase
MAMVYKIIDNDIERLKKWYLQQTDSLYIESSAAIGLEKNGEIIACCMYGRFHSKSMHQHVFIKDGERLTRDIIWFVFYYPFIQLGVNVLIAMLSTENKKIIKLCKHVGFKEKCIIENAFNNANMLIMTLIKDDCVCLNYR